jgi:hypothetical protein
MKLPYYIDKRLSRLVHRLKPHLYKWRFAPIWTCKSLSATGCGPDPVSAYNSWVDTIQTNRMAQGFLPIPGINRVSQGAR